MDLDPVDALELIAEADGNAERKSECTGTLSEY